MEERWISTVNVKPCVLDTKGRLLMIKKDKTFYEICPAVVNNYGVLPASVNLGDNVVYGQYIRVEIFVDLEKIGNAPETWFREAVAACPKTQMSKDAISQILSQFGLINWAKEGLKMEK